MLIGRFNLGDFMFENKEVSTECSLLKINAVSKKNMVNQREVFLLSFFIFTVG